MPDISTQLRDYLEGTTTPVGAREIIMGTEFKEDVTGDRRTGIPWGTVLPAAALVALVAAAVWALSPGNGTSPAAPSDPDVALVESAAEAFNANDYEALSDLLGGDVDELFGWLFGPAGMVEAKFAADASIQLDDCAREAAGLVWCSFVERNEYWGAAGVERPGEAVFSIEEGLIVNIDVDGDDEAAVVYGNSMLFWLRGAHPAVYDALPTYDGPGAGAHPMSFSTSGVPIAEAMPTVLEYVDEFVEQSRSYPVDP